MVFGMDRSEEVPAAARFDDWRELTIPKRHAAGRLDSAKPRVADRYLDSAHGDP